MKSTLFILFLVTAAIWLQAEERLLYKSYDIRTENTRPRMTKLLTDKDGLIWVGTDYGVYTFNGTNFSKIVDSEKAGKNVSSLYEDRNSRIWVGYEDGKIGIIESFRFKIFNPEEGFPAEAISDFCETNDGHIYFSTKGEGIYYFDKRLYNIDTDDGLTDNYCYAMVKLPDGRMCVATDAGLNFVSFSNGKKTVTTLGPSEGLPDEIVRCLAIENNILWIGMQDHGVARYDCNQKKLLPIQRNSPWTYGPVNSILISEGNVWMATERGIVVYDKDGFVFPVEIDGQENLKANDITVDKENNIWIAESIHLIRTSGHKLSLLSKAGEKKLSFIHCVITDPDGNLWFTPDLQLGRITFSRDDIQYKEYKIVEKADIVTLYFDKYGYLWIGTLGEGVFRMNVKTGKLRKVTHQKDFEGSTVLSINGTGDVIWVGGFNSVTKYLIESNGNSDDAVIVKKPVFEGSPLLDDYVYSVYIDSKEKTWFASDAGGIYRLEGEKLINIPVLNNAIHGFAEDRKGRIWFMTADAGIGYVGMNDELHMIQTKDGLSDPTPTSLLSLANGKLLIAHANGFDVLDPETSEFIYHSSEENLDNMNGDLNSVTTAKDGSVWIGTEFGILHYRPTSDFKLKHPEVKIRNVSLFLKPVDLKNNNRFSVDENNFSFDYAALWYTDPQRVNYLFMLDGYATKWEKTKNHSVTYPRLPPGKYHFRIRASINENFSRSDEAGFTFEILPPFWQTWWFRVLASLIIAGLIMLIVKRRENRLRSFDRLEKEKIQFQFETLKSQVNPHFLFNSFNTLISVIEDKPNMAVEYVEKLSEFFRNIVNYRDKNLVPLSEELSLLDNYIFIQRKRYGDNLILDIDINEETKEETFVAPLTLQMLAENAIKHNAVSKETPMVISISALDGKLIIKNILNRKIVGEKSAGFGLENIKARYKLLSEDEIEIVNDGKFFQVIIPLIKIEDERINS